MFHENWSIYLLHAGPGASIGGMCATRCSGSLAVRWLLSFYMFFSPIAGNHCHLLVKMFKPWVSNCLCLQGQVFGCLWLVSLVKITKIDFDVNLSLNICGFYIIPLKNLQNYFIILGMMFPPYWFVGMELCVIMSSVSRFVNPKFSWCIGVSDVLIALSMLYF